MPTPITELQLDRLFTGLEATRTSFREFREIYNPTLAFRFNALNFFKPGENKVSEILAYFLDPAEGHGQGRLFLDLFLEKFCNGGIEYATVTVYTEFRLPGERRIDILLVFDDDRYAVAIENKIWAADQKDQLLDYNTYLAGRFQNRYALFYLTPYKKGPSAHSIQKEALAALLGTHLFPIDYSTEIIALVKSWGLQCRADRVKTFLIDFQHYLEQEINGETFMNEHDIIADYVLKDSERVQTAFLVEGAAQEIRNALLQRFVKQLNELAADLQLRARITIPSEKAYSGFKFNNEALDGRALTIGFEFEEKWYRGFAFGLIKQNDSMNASLMENVRKKLDAALGVNSSSNQHWPWYAAFKEHRHWNNNTYLAIYSGELIKDIRSKVVTILEVIGAAEKETGITA